MKTMIDDIIKICKALSFKKRLKIIKLLLKHENGLFVTEVSKALNLPIGTVSRHILKLRKAGVLKKCQKEAKYDLHNKLKKVNDFLSHTGLYPQDEILMFPC